MSGCLSFSRTAKNPVLLVKGNPMLSETANELLVLKPKRSKNKPDIVYLPTNSNANHPTTWRVQCVWSGGGVTPQRPPPTRPPDRRRHGRHPARPDPEHVRRAAERRWRRREGGRGTVVRLQVSSLSSFKVRCQVLILVSSVSLLVTSSSTKGFLS